MLFALAFLFLFTIGGFSGLMMASHPVDFQYPRPPTSSWPHFHYVLVAGRGVRNHGGRVLLAAEWTGHMYDTKLANLHFWSSAISSTCCSSRSTSSASRACPRPSRTLDAVAAGTWSPRSARSASPVAAAVRERHLEVREGGQKASAEVWDGAAACTASSGRFHSPGGRTTTFDEAPVVSEPRSAPTARPDRTSSAGASAATPSCSGCWPSDLRGLHRLRRDGRARMRPGADTRRENASLTRRLLVMVAAASRSASRCSVVRT